MWYLRVFLLVFLVFGVVFAENTDTEKDNEMCKKVEDGSDYTELSFLEKMLDMGKGIKEKLPLFKFEVSPSSSLTDVLNKAKKLKLIAPGLKWCGDGDRAKHLEDLGYFKETDKCCRSHDFCKNNILAGKDLKNLKNNGLFTRSATICDTEFYNCLKNDYIKSHVPHPVSYAIGRTYFNIVKPQSFRCICPAADCDTKNDNGCMNHCDKYEWVDNPKF